MRWKLRRDSQFGCRIKVGKNKLVDENFIYCTRAKYHHYQKNRSEYGFDSYIPYFQTLSTKAQKTRFGNPVEKIRNEELIADDEPMDSDVDEESVAGHKEAAVDTRAGELVQDQDQAQDLGSDQETVKDKKPNRIFNSKKPQTCDECKEVVSCSYALGRHMHTHIPVTERARIPCTYPECKFSYLERGNLTKHINLKQKQKIRSMSTLQEKLCL